MPEMTCEHGNPVRPREEFTNDQCRICWLKLGGEKAAVEKSSLHAKIRRIKVPCVDLGPQVDRQCGQVIYLCERFKAKTTKVGQCTKAERQCSECVYYRVEGEKTEEALGVEGMTVVPRGRVRPVQWSYGLTTVPERRRNLLPATLKSLRSAGFDRPHLFIDRAALDPDGRSWEKEFGCPVTLRSGDPVRTHGNWILSLYELYVRRPDADLYAMFQDDFLTYRNLRTYLESCTYPEKGYWNLYTFPSNQRLSPAQGGWYKSNQFGRGAVALVFDRTTVQTLLQHPHMVERPTDPHRGWKAVDGGIVTSLGKAGWYEYVHSPSLVQHTGDVSSMGNKPHLKAESFRGEDFDATELIVHKPR